MKKRYKGEDKMNFWDTVLGNELARTLTHFMQNNDEIGTDIKKLNENLEKIVSELEKLNKDQEN